MKIFIAILFVILSFLVQASQSFAYEIPNFTSCVNPQGEIKANYETGTHGIAGKIGSFEGKDAVYKISENALTQCFCAVDGSGIQTNWWKIPSLTASEIKTLEAQGWIYISNGALWGLEDAQYLAKNSDFSCKPSTGNGNSGGNNSTNGSGNSSGSVSSSSSGGMGEVLGLASTGNSVFLLGVALISGLSLLTGLIFKKRSKKLSK